MTRKDQNLFFHASARRGKTKIRFFMFLRGAERPKFVFSCFRVARKDQNSIFHASAHCRKTKKRFFTLLHTAERLKVDFSRFCTLQKGQKLIFHASAHCRKAKKKFFMLLRGAERPKRRGERSSKADEPFSSLFKSIVSAYYQSCKRSLSGKYILSPFFTFHAL